MADISNAIEQDINGAKRFNVSISSDGLQRKFGNYSNIDLEEAVDEVWRFDPVNQKYSREEIEEIFIKLPINYRREFGSRWFTITVTRIKDGDEYEVKCDNCGNIDGIDGTDGRCMYCGATDQI